MASCAENVLSIVVEVKVHLPTGLFDFCLFFFFLGFFLGILFLFLLGFFLKFCLYYLGQARSLLKDKGPGA